MLAVHYKPIPISIFHIYNIFKCFFRHVVTTLGRVLCLHFPRVGTGCISYLWIWCIAHYHCIFISLTASRYGSLRAGGVTLPDLRGVRCLYTVRGVRLLYTLRGVRSLYTLRGASCYDIGRRDFNFTVGTYLYSDDLGLSHHVKIISGNIGHNRLLRLCIKSVLSNPSSRYLYCIVHTHLGVDIYFN